MTGSIVKAVVSAAYWLLVGFLMIGLFMGDPVTPQADSGPGAAWALIAGAVVGWALLSWLWDRMRRN